MKNVTAVIISFLRQEYARACITSLKTQHPDIKLLVAENGEYDHEFAGFVKSHGGRYLVMPFDSGVCYARNRLVEQVDTEYVLVGDDDFFYTPDTGADKMLKFLQKNKTKNLIGGRINENGEIRNYQGFIDFEKDHLVYRMFDETDCKKDRSSKLRYHDADITFNFFIARTEIVKRIKWDEQIKVAYEHSDWFISLKKAGIGGIVYTPDVIVIHKPPHVNVSRRVEYKKYRHRKEDRFRFFEKHGIEYTIGFNGKRQETETLFIEKKPKDEDAYHVTHAMNIDGKVYNVGDVIHTKNPNVNMRKIE